MSRIFYTTLLAALGTFAFPLFVFAARSEPPPIPGGPYVPVVDIWVNVAFAEIMLTNPDSVRNIITGTGKDEDGHHTGAKYYPDLDFPPDENYGIPGELCKLKGPWDTPMSWYLASGYDQNAVNTPWYRATETADPEGPPAINRLAFEDILVNDSTSLTCLLQELVEWQKLQLFLNIHDMIREYIADVQAQQLAMKLEGLIARANTDWSRQAIERCEIDESGKRTCTTDSVTNVDPAGFTDKLKSARAETLQQRIAGDANSPAGYTNSCETFKYDMAADLADQALYDTADPLDTLSSYTQCGLTDENNPENGLFATAEDADDWAAGNFDEGQYGGWISWMGTLRNSPNSRLMAETDLSVAQIDQLNDVQEQVELMRVAPGTLPDIEFLCSETDPNCDLRYAQIQTNAQMVSDRINNYASFGDRAIADTDSLDDYAAEATTNQSIELLTQGGFEDYNTGRISDLQPPIDEYIREFYGAIEYGYFDLYEETQDWAQGALLNIYDSMSFSPNLYEKNQAIPDIDNADDLLDVY